MTSPNISTKRNLIRFPDFIKKNILENDKIQINVFFEIFRCTKLDIIWNFKIYINIILSVVENNKQWTEFFSFFPYYNIMKNIFVLIVLTMQLSFQHVHLFFLKNQKFPQPFDHPFISQEVIYTRKKVGGLIDVR